MLSEAGGGMGVVVAGVLAEEVGGWGLGGVKTRRYASGARSRVSSVTKVLSGRLSTAATQNLPTMRVQAAGAQLFVRSLRLVHAQEMFQLLEKPRALASWSGW